MLVLAVHVDQLLAELAQLCERDRRAVDERAAATAGVDGAPDQHEAGIVAGEFAFGKPACDRRGRAELGRDIGPRGAFAHDVRVGALTECEQQSVDQDRLAGTGLAGEDSEAGCELEFEPVDDHKVSDRQRNQHAMRGW